MLLALVALPLFATPQANPFPQPKTPTAVVAVGCRQGECMWQQIRTIERVKADRGEVLRKVTGRTGRSTYSVYGRPPARAPRNIAWERGPSQEYVRCSKRSPATARWDAEDREWLVTRFDLTNLGGYQYSSANLYMQVCHNLAPGKWRERGVGRMGYRKAPSDQERYKSEREMLRAMD